MAMDILGILFGFALLLGGAEIMVRGAAFLAARFGIPRLVVGMTVVAVGTSAPEFLIVLDSALAGSGGLAVGSVVGSNIANILLILGAAAMIAPIRFDSHRLVREAALLVVGTGLFAALALRGTIDLAAGIVLAAAFVVIFAYSILRSSETATPYFGHEERTPETRFGALAGALAMLAAGIAGLVIGADVLVESAISLARRLGVSDAVIGLTVMAFGTSLPELAAAIVAAYRQHAGIAIGNIVGSNLFNVVGILGVVALIRPIDVPARVVQFDLWIMLAATAAVAVVLLLPKPRFGRGLGAVFLLCYLGYIAAIAAGVSAFR